MHLRQVTLRLLFLLAVPLPALTQDVTLNNIINVTFSTNAPVLLGIDRGRLIWKDADPNTGTFALMYYSGAGVTKLDSNLVALTASIGGDYVVWNTAGELVKAYDPRNPFTSPLGQSYNPDFTQPVTVSNNLAAYARRRSGGGTQIVLHRFASGTDTLLSGAVWNTAPSLHHGQLAWVAADSESSTASSDIFSFDGRSTANVSRTIGIRNRAPVLRDGQIAWLQTGGGPPRVKLYTGDTTVTIAQSPGGSTVVAGYDESDGIAVAALTDTVSHTSSITIYNAETGVSTTLGDSLGASALHISSGLVVWQSGTGVNKKLRTFSVQGALLQDLGAAENPIIDRDIIAWTLGDAVEMRRPITYRQLTTDGLNGWEQTKFKTLDSTHVVWGNFANSVNMRLFAWDGVTTTQLTDSTITKDFVMVNDGYAIWRSNSDSLFSYDGIHKPIKFLDTVQAENPYLAGGSVGFHGRRTTVNDIIQYAWLYEIQKAKLTRLSSDSGFTGNVLCSANTACWRSGQTEKLMYYDGTATVSLSDSVAGEDYSYRNGKIVWSERRSGVWQIMLYDVARKAKSQITSGPSSKVNPMTDGQCVVWYEDPVQVVTIVTGDMWYYNIASGRASFVARTKYRVGVWNWMSNGKIAWLHDGNITVFDGNVINQLSTNDGFRVYSGLYLDHDFLVWKRAIAPGSVSGGDIFRQKLTSHAAFDAVNIGGAVPLTVSFTNRSWEGMQGYTWDFGDGTTSHEANPTHTYLTPGRFTVTLTVTGPTGQDSERKFRVVRAVSSTGVAGQISPIPQYTVLRQNYPNPFNPATVIGYELSGSGFVSLKVYDLLGREVETLVNEPKAAGAYTATWNAARYASGVYFYRLTTGSFVQTRSLLLIR